MVFRIIRNSRGTNLRIPHALGVVSQICMIGDHHFAVGVLHDFVTHNILTGNGKPGNLEFHRHLLRAALHRMNGRSGTGFLVFSVLVQPLNDSTVGFIIQAQLKRIRHTCLSVLDLDAVNNQRRITSNAHIDTSIAVACGRGLDVRTPRVRNALQVDHMSVRTIRHIIVDVDLVDIDIERD